MSTLIELYDTVKCLANILFEVDCAGTVTVELEYAIGYEYNKRLSKNIKREIMTRTFSKQHSQNEDIDRIRTEETSKMAVKAIIWRIHISGGKIPQNELMSGRFINDAIKDYVDEKLRIHGKNKLLYKIKNAGTRNSMNNNNTHDFWADIEITKSKKKS